MPRVRLDQRLPALGLTPSREQARRLIMAGNVLVDGQLVDRPAALIADEAVITLKAKPRFVSRGGEKLAAALTAFAVPVTGRVCADVGASTGGFTDCLLQHGAARVYALDVGYGILDYRLRTDPRVVVMEKTNARHVAQLPEPAQLVVMDASFISLRLLLPAARGWLAPDADVIALIKPQFEAGRAQADKTGGVIRDPAIHRQVLREILAWATANGWRPRGLLRSPLKGGDGNVEFLTRLSAEASAEASAGDVRVFVVENEIEKVIGN
jgi:23S rRNA (cytidine1920-2'-O)/16S rRNA (cytidine1409-2'-O)-methyltransferase